MRNTFTLLCGVVLLSAACNKQPAAVPTSEPVAVPSAAAPPAVAAVAPTHAAAAAPIEAQPAAAGTGKFGAPLSAAPTVAVSAVLADAKKYDDKDVKVTGTVSAACQKKGCWMTIGTGEAGAQTVRVSFKDYGFFVPKDCLGKKAVVEGHFKVSTMSVAEAQHYAEDAAKEGAPVKKVTEPQKTYALVATGVELM